LEYLQETQVTAWILLTCLAAGAPRNICLAEVDYGCVATHPWGDLSWVNSEWPWYAAHIVASEARGVPQADIVIACTLVRDVVEGSYKYRPFELHTHGRWNGWGTPDELDEEAIYRALLTDTCADMPRYQFVGSFKDAQYWRSIGMIPEGPFDLFVGKGGQAVVGVPYD